MATSSWDCSLEELLFKGKFDDNYPIISTKIICPIEVLNCNGVFPTNFNSAQFELKSQKGLHLSALFCQQGFWLYQVLAAQVEDDSDIVKNLQHFFKNEIHAKCLQTLPALTRKSQTLAVLAVHLFGPLAANGSCMVNKNCFVKSSRICPSCGEKVNLGDTSFGNQEVWYGNADMIVRRSVVHVELSSWLKQDDHNIPSDTDDDDNTPSDTDDLCTDLDQTREPVKKKTRISYVDTTDGESDDSVVSHEDTNNVLKNGTETSSQCIDEVERMSSESQPLYQALAQTITNAFLQVKISPCMSSTLIPSFLASEKSVQLLMYCCSNDLLLVSEELPLFDPETNKLNVSTIIYLWLSLNIDVPAQSIDIIGWSCSNFSEFANKCDKYRFYTDGITCPLDYNDNDSPKLVFEPSVLSFLRMAPYAAEVKKIYRSASKKLLEKN